MDYIQLNERDRYMRRLQRKGKRLLFRGNNLKRFNEEFLASTVDKNDVFKAKREQENERFLKNQVQEEVTAYLQDKRRRNIR